MQIVKKPNIHSPVAVIKSLLTAFILFITSSLLAQGTLSVEVEDEAKGKIEFANLRVFSPIDSTVVAGGYTNEEGKLTIEKLPFGSFYGIISFFGFDEYLIPTINITKEKSKVNLGRVYLSAIKSQEFEEVIVKGKDRNIMESGIDKRTYNVAEDMTSMGGEASDILNNIPSVEVDNEGNISLRGNSSVKILIDGRESALTSGDDPLAGIPASAIERVEIVTNPSAKYNPEGTAGIINIVLKKTKLRGFNANVQLSAATGNLYNGSLGFNYRNEHLNFFANYSFRYAENKRENFSKRRSENNGITEFLDQNILGMNIRRRHTFNLGADFFIKDNQVIGVSFNGGAGKRPGWSNQRNEVFLNNVLDRYWDRTSSDPSERKNLDLSTNYKWDFKDKTGNLMASASGSMGNNNSAGTFNEYYFNPDGTPYEEDEYRFQDQNRSGTNSNYSINIDLERAINGKMRYETGIETRIRRMYDSNYMESLDLETGEITPDYDLINELKHNEDIFSAYGIFGHEITEKLKYQVGVRLEQAFVNPQFLSSDESFDYTYFALYPSIHLAYGDDKMGTFFGSYSRRVNRPSPWQMNPFPIISDPLNIREGNPGLLPEFINSYELGYEKMWNKGSISATAYFKQTQNKIQRITLFRDDGVSISTFDNIDQSYDYGLEVIGTFTPFPWWRNMLSVNAYESIVSANFNGTTLNNRGLTWNAKINMNFSLFKNKTNIQVIGGYSAPRHTVQGTFQYSPGIDVGVTHSFFDKKLVLGLRVSDVFDQKGYFMKVNDQGREQTTQFKWTSRRLFFTVSYKFGNLKAKEEGRKSYEGGGDIEMM